ncbi:MAG: MFS transporter [Clostridiales bacterium]|nr:MFS transporter [Clostridiales bacterium]
MKTKMNTIRELKDFLILWSTQALSSLGSGMTGFALVLWSYGQSGSALTTALLTVCSYAPYVLMSVLSGAVSDRWNKKITMLVCDFFAAACTVTVLLLLKTDMLRVWHLYVLNALNGLMSTFQQPAADVSTTLLLPKKHFQKVGALRSFSGSLVSILTPVLASAVYTLLGLDAVILIDLATFLTAFLALLFFIRIPNENGKKLQESVGDTVRAGLRYLKRHKGVFHIMLFLAAINFTASVYEAALPALIIPHPLGGENALGVQRTATGVAMLLGSLIALKSKTPRSRVRVVCNTLLLSMCTENFLLALGHRPWLWAVGAVLGWISIPLMNTNLDALLRSYIPVDMQGRVYAARNTFQFFTIPLGYLAGGYLVDRVYEPFMAQKTGTWLNAVFGTGKSSGAALLFFCIAFLGIITCLIFRKDKRIWELEK